MVMVSVPHVVNSSRLIDAFPGQVVVLCESTPWPNVRDVTVLPRFDDKRRFYRVEPRMVQV